MSKQFRVAVLGATGLVGDTMHQVDERAPVADLHALTAVYRGFLERFFAGAGTA